MTDIERPACPMEFAPFDASYLTDPYPIFDLLRAEPPAYSAPLDMWVISRHADVRAILLDHETFSASIAQDPVFDLAPEAIDILASGFKPIRTMSNLDGPEHTRIRKHNQVGFSPRRLRNLEPVARDTCRALIDSIDRSKPFDIVETLTHPMPASIIFSLLGFPSEDTPTLKGWCGDRMSFSWGKPTSAEQVAIASDMVDYWRYCEGHIERRLHSPADDFTSDLLAIHTADPKTLSLHEITHIIYGLSFAGHETTTNLMSNALRQILSIEGLWQTIGSDPALIPAIVDEALRHDTSVVAWRRIATTRTNIGGTEVPAGAKLLLLLGSANRDPSVFEDPDLFIPDRGNANRHLSFGLGKHFCLGATLTKVELSTVLNELSQAFPALSLVEEPLEFHPNISFRGPRQLLLDPTESHATQT